MRKAWWLDRSLAPPSSRLCKHLPLKCNRFLVTRLNCRLSILNLMYMPFRTSTPETIRFFAQID